MFSNCIFSVLQEKKASRMKGWQKNSWLIATPPLKSSTQTQPLAEQGYCFYFHQLCKTISTSHYHLFAHLFCNSLPGGFLIRTLFSGNSCSLYGWKWGWTKRIELCVVTAKQFCPWGFSECVGHVITTPLLHTKPWYDTDGMMNMSTWTTCVCQGQIIKSFHRSHQPGFGWFSAIWI